MKINFRFLQIFITSFLFTIVFTYIPAYALNKDECPELSNKVFNINGTVKDVDLTDYKAFVIIKTEREEVAIGVDGDEYDEFEKMIGKSVDISYAVNQYWDDHDDECVRASHMVSFSLKNSGSSDTAYKNGYGPKIFGFQLGMSRDEAKSVIEQYAKKHNIKYDGKDSSLYNDRGKIFDVAFLSSKQAQIYFVGNQAFQVDDMEDKGFLQALLNKYNIPEVKPEKYQSPFGNGIKYVYTDNSAGFRLEVFPNYLTVSSVPKKSNKPAVFE